jgi:Resolvase, N terminal domain
MASYGYACVSCLDQNLGVQRAALKAAGCDFIRAETASRTRCDGRTELQVLLYFLRPGYALVVTRIDRLARSLQDLQNIVHELRERRVTLRATEQPIDTGTAAGKAFLDMLGVFAEFETNLRKERQVKALPQQSYAACTRAGSRRSTQHRSQAPLRGKAGGLPRSHDGSASAAPASIAFWGRRRRSHAYTPRAVAPHPPHWRELSSRVRFERAGGRCQRCRRPHLALVGCLPDGAVRRASGDLAGSPRAHGQMARSCGGHPVPDDPCRACSGGASRQRPDEQPADEPPRALSSACHLLHDRSHHLAQRSITCRRRLAIGDLFLGPYPA